MSSFLKSSSEEDLEEIEKDKFDQANSGKK